MSKKKTDRPMVPTTDTIKLPNGKELKVTPIRRISTASKEVKDKLFEAFKKDGLCPEERLLAAIFGEKPEKGLPQEQRTRKAFDILYSASEAARQKMHVEDEYIHGGKRCDIICGKYRRQAISMRKAGMSDTAIAKALKTTAYSVKFCLSDDFKKPHILLLGEAQLRNAEKNGDKSLEKIAHKNIQEGLKSMALKAKVDAELKAKRKKSNEKAKKIAEKVNARVRFAGIVKDRAELTKLRKSGKVKAGSIYGLECNCSEYIFDGFKFVKIFEM